MKSAVLSATVLSVTAILITGCGLGSTANPIDDSPIIAGTLRGQIMGGVTPIVGATVKIYTTGSASSSADTTSYNDTGYGVGYMRQEANQVGTLHQDTGADGSFYFAGGYSCPKGEFLYIVSSGGNTGSSSTGSGAMASATVDQTPTDPAFEEVTSIPVSNGGNNYGAYTISITAPNDPVAVTAGTAVQAKATPGTIVNGVIQNNITVSNPGYGYLTAPTVTITGVSVPNNNAVLMAALGRCDDLFTNGAGNGYTGSFIYMNELSTVAAGYALSGFFNNSTPVAYATANDATTVSVGIGSTATNNSQYQSSGGYSTGCVTGITTAGASAACSTTAAAGLLHAFQNAANLYSVFSPNGSPANPSANTTIANNTQSPSPIVPTALINQLANSMVACVNSTNNSVTDPASACVNFLALGGPSGTPATDTLTAIRYMARNPALTGAGGTATGNCASTTTPPPDPLVCQVLTNATAQTSVYSPNLQSLTSYPTDLSFAIVYPAGTGANGIAAGTAGAVLGTSTVGGIGININDDVYIGNENIGSPSYGNVVALQSDGQVLTSALSNSSTAYLSPRAVALDAYGSVFAEGYTTPNTYPLLKFPIATGSFGFPASAAIKVACTYLISGTTYSCSPAGSTAHTLSIAVDKKNDVFFNTTGGAVASTSPYTVYQVPYFSSTTPSSTTGYINVTTPAVGDNQISIDPDQNIWGGSQTGTTVTILKNTGSVATPTYGTGTTTSTIPGVDGGILFAPNGSSYFAISLRDSKTPNAAGAIVSGLSTSTVTITTAAVTGVTAGGTLNGTLNDAEPIQGAVDGSSVVWANNTTSNAGTYAGTFGITYNTATPTTVTPGGVISPCYNPSSTACAGLFTSANYAFNVAVDAAGSIWTDNGAGGQVVQIIGSATPVWPLLSLGLSGSKP